MGRSVGIERFGKIGTELQGEEWASLLRRFGIFVISRLGRLFIVEFLRSIYLHCTRQFCSKDVE